MAKIRPSRIVSGTGVTPAESVSTICIGTVFAGHQQPLKIWMLYSSLMELNLANVRISKELGLSEIQTLEKAAQLRLGLADRLEPIVLEGEEV